MPGFSYDRYESRRPARNRSRGLFGFWIPVIVTTTLAAGALGAWVLQAREDHEPSSSDDDDENLSYEDENVDELYGPPARMRGGLQDGHGYRDSAAVMANEASLFERVQSTIRRTPSPQQIFDGASKKVVSGVAAVSAVVGGALSAIREDGEDDFADHQRWRDAGSAASGKRSGPLASNSRRRTVAIVVSAKDGEIDCDDHERDSWKNEHASLLSHIPTLDPSTTNLQFLIYAPHYQSHPSTPGSVSGHNAPSSVASSSYTHIHASESEPGHELSRVDPMPVHPPPGAISSASYLYTLMYKQAARLTDSPAAIMPFTSPVGFTHMLKHLSPDVVYLSDSLAGQNGKNVEDIKGWVGQIVVVVGERGAGLVDDTDREDEAGKVPSWWQTSQSVGLGKGIEVVEAVRISDDWNRRVGGHD